MALNDNEYIDTLNERIINFIMDKYHTLTDNELFILKNHLSPITYARLSQFFQNNNNLIFVSNSFSKFIDRAHPVEIIGNTVFREAEDDLDKVIGDLVDDAVEYIDFRLRPNEGKELLRKLLKRIGGCFQYVAEEFNVKQLIENSDVDLLDGMKKMGLNVYLTVKECTEDPKVFPLARRITNINKLTFLNFASSTFISGRLISGSYADYYKDWYFENLKSGDLETNVIINNPHSYAAKDAALSKMNPKRLYMGKDEIIQHNINELYKFCLENKSAKINLFLTDICLPYGIMYGENYLDASIDFMKVDLYSPLGEQDDIDGFDNERLSFYLLKSDYKTREIYRLFLGAVKRIINDKKRTKVIRLHEKRKTDWLVKKPFIHRGKYNNNIPDHSVRGYLECIKNKYPMEVDVFFLKDGEIIVGRDEKVINKKTSEIIKYSELNANELRRLCTDNFTDTKGNQLRYRIEELMTFSEFLDMINGKIDLLIEVKTNGIEKPTMLSNIASSIVKSLRYYTGKYAIHSANPYVLKCIRELDCLVPLGQISWSFKGIAVENDFRELHTEFKFLDVFIPDFISYSVKEISGNLRLKDICEKHKLPLLAWAITNKEEELTARHNGCKNIIIEGAPTYLD